MSANSNYPAGIWAGDPKAPWNAPEPPECMNEKCCASLETEWEFCPYCGMHIDWDAYEQDGDDWYAEESADYLDKEVYEPIRARWGE